MPIPCMILSVIIVNYNVKYFLEQCLYSVEKALQEMEGEIFVVDNHSSDDSVAYLQPKFPRVRFMVNEENKGFAKGNNQALREARGKYILFLNPDTILPEDFFKVCLSFTEPHPPTGASSNTRASYPTGTPTPTGALGVRMIDGSGHFLKESRRGFPSPWVAFCKLTGLTALFPHSRWLSEYYLGYLSPEHNHPAPVLSGACMWVSREALDKAGSFDEQFFMYAEDIDLSHRIGRKGYTNYYIADTTILHFKGESTRKDVRYVRMFYKAMSQFRQKHFSGGLSALYNVLMETAIWLRAGVTALAGSFRRPIGPTHAADRPRKTWVTGDPAGITRMTVALASDTARKLVSEKQDADEIILCEGQSFSFRDCIEALQNARRGVSCKIHAAGSGAAVGSHSKEEQGQVIVL